MGGGVPARQSERHSPDVGHRAFALETYVEEIAVATPTSESIRHLVVQDNT